MSKASFEWVKWLSTNHGGDNEVRRFCGRPQHYILEGGKLKPVPLLVWARWLDNPDNNRQIADARIDGVRISTVFLGLDHNWQPEGPALVFETMIFGGDHDGFCERYATLDEAKQGHKRVVAMVKGTME